MLRDNTTFKQKVALRRLALAECAEPVIMETHGGTGELYKACYRRFPAGVVFEKDEERAARLCRQRPTWSVYEVDCVDALTHGAGNHLEINLLDIDPYGEPHSTLAAFFHSDRPFAPTMQVVVNDGLRRNIKLGVAWRVHVLQNAVLKFGNDIYDQYLEVCRSLMEEKAARAGYTLTAFKGYYCGHLKQMTHYWATLTQS
jgi:hypothetical protein